MTRAFILLICVITVSCIGWTAVAAGVSLKNVLLYGATTGLILQAVLGRRPKMQVPAVQVCFGVLLGYAVLSTYVVGAIGHFPRYNVMGAVQALKASLIDWMVYFVVFFYGCRTAADAAKVMRVMLIALGVAQLVTLWNAVGLPEIGRSVIGMEDGARVNGFFGHANETGTMIATLLPAYVVAVLEARGRKKLFWAALLGASITVLFATMSRGAIVALLLGVLWGAVMCRKYISFTRTIKYSLLAAAVATPVLLFAGSGYIAGLMARFAGFSSGNVADVSSGRTIIWQQAFDVLSQNPVYFISGVGWNTWFSSGLMNLGAHNQYLQLYFELGLVGLFSYVLLLGSIVRAPLQALRVAPSQQRSMLVSFVFSVLILAVGLLFSSLGVPWGFLWIFFALSLRQVVEIPEWQRLTGTASASPSVRAPMPTMIAARSARKASGAF